ncbi:MAG: rhomboid family intramembrane serine protease [Deltaproteobacteria bacterium]|nr:rhomboid family intramembrane serine protease [Deltaproteobacteria bacterium]MBI3294072.1 rhomboid family intramembrane serine protease [Deltaproteobacteria bacterium]
MNYPMTLALLLLCLLFTAIGQVFPTSLDHFALFTGAPLRHAGLTLITSLFLHGGWNHLFGNAILLLLFGRAFEHASGPKSLALLFLLGGITGSLAHTFTDATHNSLLMGSSAGVLATLVFVVIALPQARVGGIGPLSATFPARSFALIYGTISLLGLATQHFVLPHLTPLLARSPATLTTLLDSLLRSQEHVAIASHVGGATIGIVAGFFARMRSP